MKTCKAHWNPPFLKILHVLQLVMYMFHHIYIPFWPTNYCIITLGLPFAWVQWLLPYSHGCLISKLVEWWCGFYANAIVVVLWIPPEKHKTGWILRLELAKSSSNTPTHPPKSINALLFIDICESCSYSSSDKFVGEARTPFHSPCAESPCSEAQEYWSNELSKRRGIHGVYLLLLTMSQVVTV